MSRLKNVCTLLLVASDHKLVSQGCVAAKQVAKSPTAKFFFALSLPVLGLERPLLIVPGLSTALSSHPSLAK